MRIRAKVELFSEKDADPRWRITTGFVVGRHYSVSSNRPVMPGASGEFDPLTIVLGEDEDAAADNLYHRLGSAPDRRHSLHRSRNGVPSPGNGHSPGGASFSAPGPRLASRGQVSGTGSIRSALASSGQAVRVGRIGPLRL